MMRKSGKLPTNDRKTVTCGSGFGEGTPRRVIFCGLPKKSAMRENRSE